MEKVKLIDPQFLRLAFQFTKQVLSSQACRERYARERMEIQELIAKRAINFTEDGDLSLEDLAIISDFCRYQGYSEPNLSRKFLEAVSPRVF